MAQQSPKPSKTNSNLLHLIIAVPVILIIIICSLILYLAQGTIYRQVEPISDFLTSQDTTAEKEKLLATVVNKNAQLTLEIADSNYERIKGLQGREALAENEGVLFIFSDEDHRTFWMYNTPISLDIAFLDADKRIINIHKDTTPNNTAIKYTSQSPAQYVIETRAGWFETYHVQEGDFVEFTL